MVNPGLLERIVYAKYLFHQGCESMEKNLPITDGMAVLSFQDAVEMLLRTIAEHVQASLKDGAAFNLIIDKIDEDSDTHKKGKIPQRIALIQLNRARVSFKHSGLLPNTSDVHKLRQNTELFFHTALQQFFGLTLDEVSLVQLIKRHRVKNHLLEAERYFYQDQFVDCINSTAKALALLLHNVSETIELKDSPLGRFDDRKIETAMTAIQKQFQEHQEYLNILKFGINLAEYERFKSLSPNLNISTVRVIVGYPLDSQYDIRSLEDARFCLRFTTDATLRIQHNPIPKRPLIKESLRKFRITQKTVMIVYPHPSDIEQIRSVESGEVLTGYYKNHDQDDYVAVLEDEDIGYIHKDVIEKIK